MGDSLSGIPPPPPGFTDEVPPPPEGFTEEIPPPPAGFTEELTPPANARDPSFLGGLGQDWRRGTASLYQNWAGTRASALQTLEQNQGLVEAYPGGPKVPILPDPTDPTKAAPETQQAIQAGYTDVASDLVRHQATIAANPAPQSVQDIAKAGNDRDFAAAWTAFKTHPLEAIASTTVGSLPQMLAAMGIGVVTRNPGLSAATMGLTSGASEWGNAIVDALQDAAKARNIPLTAETAAMLMQDPELMAAARQRGAIRGLVVGGFDALSGGMAGFNFVPKQLVKGTVKRELANLVPQALSQGIMGGAGEAGGEYLATGQVKWGDALLEVIGEFGGAPIEVGTMGYGQVSERLNAASARRQAGQPAAPGDVDAVQAGLSMLDTAIAEARAKGNEAGATKMQAARDQMAANFTDASGGPPPPPAGAPPTYGPPTLGGQRQIDAAAAGPVSVGPAADPRAAAGKVIDRTAQDELAAVQQRQNAGVSPESMTEAQRREAGIVPGMPEAEAIRRAMIYEDEQRVLRGEITGQPVDAQPPTLPPVIAMPDRSLAPPGDTTPLNRGTPVGDLPGLVSGANLRGGGTGAALVPTEPPPQRMTPEEVAAAQQRTRQQDREQAARGQQPQADTRDIDTQIARIDKTLASPTMVDENARASLERQKANLEQARRDRLGIGRPMTGTAEGQARSAGQQEMVQTAEEMRAADRTKADQAFTLAQRQRFQQMDEGRLIDIADDANHPDAPMAAWELRRRERGDTTQAGMDTQPAGQPGGLVRTQVTTHVQDGVEHPVKVMGREGGRVLVQRYDPRTGETLPDSTPYIVNVGDLNTRTYTQEPRRSQDVTQRAGVGRVSEGRAKGQRIDTVQGLPAQTYRTTQEDPNTQFPGAEAERDTGRSPIPEQTQQDRRTWTREEEFMRDYAAREEQRRREDEEAQRQRRHRREQTDETPRPKGKKGERSTNEAKAVDGAFPVDADGHVVSTGGGPIIFGTQLQAAKWILNVGHKESARQIFQIANHPTTNNTFSVQETGLSDEPSADTGDQAGPAPDEPGPTPKPPPPPPQLGGPTPPPASGPPAGGPGGSAGPAAPSGSGTEPGGSPASGGGGSPGGPAPTAVATPEPESTDPRSGPFPHDEQFGGEAMMLLSAQVSLDRVARGANPEWVKAQAQAQYDQALADMRRKGATEQQIKDIQDNIAARRAATDAERVARAGEGQQATPEPQATGDVKPGEPGPHPTMTRLAAPVPTKPGQRTETENHLLIVQCSDTKSTAPGEIAAIDRYDGPFARQIRALEKGLRPTILFISGKFGLVGGDQPLPNYDQALNPERVDALQRDDEVTGQRLEDYINEGQFESVLLLGGENYRVAIGDHLHNAVEASENTPPALEQPTGDLLNLRKELGSWLRAIQPGSPPRYATEAGPQASAETTAAPAAPAGLSPVERARRLDTPEMNKLKEQLAKIDKALDTAGIKEEKAGAVFSSSTVTDEQRARAQAAFRAARDEQTKLRAQRDKLTGTMNDLTRKLLAPEPTAAPAAPATPEPGKREQTTRGKEAQSVAVAGIRYAARESPVGKWMGNFEARIWTNSPVMAAISNRVPTALRPFVTRAAYAGIEAVNAGHGVEAAKKARLAAIQKINSEAVAAMKGDGNTSAADRALSRQFSEDLTYAFNRGEDIAGQMQEEGKAIPEQRQIDATARTSRGQATTYQFGSAAAAEATAERLSKQKGATFYSFPGMLFDPQLWAGLGKGVAALGKLLTGTREDWEQFHGTMTALGTSLSNLASNVTQAPAAFASGVMTVMERTVGAAVRSGGGALRAMARARNSPTLLQLVNDLDAPSRSQYGGEGSGVRPFNEAFKIKRNNVGRQITALTERLTELVKSAPRQPGESVADRMQRVHDQLAKMVRNPGGRRGELGRLATDVAALLKGLRDYAVAAGVEMGNVGAGYLPRMFDADAVAAKPAEFLKIARDAYMRQGVPLPDAKNYAQELLQDVQKGGFGIPGHAGAFAGAPASVKSRTFDSQAERAFQNAGHYVNDVERLLLTYRDQIIRRAEIARRWGDGWKDWHDKVIAPLIAEPGNNQAWLGNYAANYAETITGVKPTVGSRGIQNTLGALRAATAFSALNEVAITSLLEATAVANRTGRPDEAVRALFGSFHEAYRDIFKLPVSQRRQVAEDLGLLAGDVLASAQAGRFGAGDGTRMELAKKEARFYRTIKLEQITNGQYVSVAQSGIRMLDRAAEGILGNASWMSPERGKSVLSELGIPADKAEAFARYWQSIRRDNQGKNTRQPLPEHYATALGEMAQTALYRFVTQTIQTPDAGSKPRWASTTFGSLVFNLNSFAWAFARNVTIANFKLAGKAITGKDTGTGLKGLADRAAYLAPAIIGTGMAMMANYAVIGIKDAIGGTDDEDIERRTNGWWWEQVARRSGLLMVADPIIQASMAGIYGREPITSLSGPSVGILAELLSAGNQLIVKNSEKSNSAERRAAQAAFDAVVKPAAIYMLLAASVPGALNMATVVGAGWKGTRRLFTDTAAGEESDTNKMRRQRKPQQGYFEQVFGGES